MNDNEEKHTMKELGFIASFCISVAALIGFIFGIVGGDYAGFEFGKSVATTRMTTDLQNEAFECYLMIELGRKNLERDEFFDRLERSKICKANIARITGYTYEQ